MRNKVLDHRNNGWPQDPRLRGDDELISGSLGREWFFWPFERLAFCPDLPVDRSNSGFAWQPAGYTFAVGLIGNQDGVFGIFCGVCGRIQ